MLENREVTFRLNKKDQGKGQGSPGMNPSDNKAFEDKVIFLEKMGERIAKRVIIGVCAYVLVDTVRKVVVTTFEQV